MQCLFQVRWSLSWTLLLRLFLHLPAKALYKQQLFSCDVQSSCLTWWRFFPSRGGRVYIELVWTVKSSSQECYTQQSWLWHCRKNALRTSISISRLKTTNGEHRNCREVDFSRGSHAILRVLEGWWRQGEKWGWFRAPEVKSCFESSPQILEAETSEAKTSISIFSSLLWAKIQRTKVGVCIWGF